MARFTKTFLILGLAAACSTTAFARQNELPPIFPPTLSKAIDRYALKNAAPFRMKPLRQISTATQLPIAETAQLQPTQPPEQADAKIAVEAAPHKPDSAVAQSAQSKTANIVDRFSAFTPKPSPTPRYLLNDQTLNQDLDARQDFGTVMMFPAQNDIPSNVNQPSVAASQAKAKGSNFAQPQVAQINDARQKVAKLNDIRPNVALLNGNQTNVYRGSVDPSSQNSGQRLPTRNSLQELAQPRTIGTSPSKLASLPYPPSRDFSRPKPGVYSAPISRFPEFTDSPSVERNRIERNRIEPPEMSSVPPLPSRTPHANAPKTARLNYALETTVIGPEMLVRDVPEAFEIVIANTSRELAKDIVVQLAVPKGLTLTELDRRAWVNAKNRTVSWSIDELPSGSKEVIRYSSVSGKPGRHQQSITVGMQNSYQGQTNFESFVIQNDDHENIQYLGFEDE